MTAQPMYGGRRLHARCAHRQSMWRSHCSSAFQSMLLPSGCGCACQMSAPLWHTTQSMSAGDTFSDCAVTTETSSAAADCGA